MSLASAPITLLRFPRDDHAFESFLERIADALGDFLDPETFQDRVRETYPGAVVHPQDPLGGYRVSGSVWYVYRDGSPLRDSGTDGAVREIA